jgi:ABC-type uncharacterized transport system auxiliary subunit
MKNFCRTLKKTSRFLIPILWALLLFFTGCAGTGRPPYNIDTYLLSYPPPVVMPQKPIAAAIKFNRFSIAAVYNSVNMIYRGDAHSVDSFNYSRWAVNPADMIADRLASDLRAGGFFQAVFSRHDVEEGRFILAGGVEDFYLKTDGPMKKAVVGLVISLIDAREIRSSKKILFQKKYKREEVLEEASPKGYARAASLAVKALSEQVINDVYQAAKNEMP